ncbi:unnamed protein product [Dracunculus medinensis]|uniref:AA_permease domain-containing protein n=1 Tax=Dracunculus medinensis TaxID=318479 RepID=A0A0N4UMC3_DRAME|nr:unnamed protein product [Dracunculus medinensis]
MMMEDQTTNKPAFDDVSTIDVPPNFDNYSSNTTHRPSIGELIGNKKIAPFMEKPQITIAKELSEESENGDVRFGWITGVFLRCVLSILGATLFLRMGWMSGQTGIILGTSLILISSIVAILTAISMSAIATNGEISRSLGPEFGGSIGLIFYIANLVNASMNCVGLAESIVFLLNENSWSLIDGVICLILQCIIFIGTAFESKTQLVFLFSLLISVITYIIGTFFPSNDYRLNRGITGYSARTATSNILPDFRSGETPISIFGVYFPTMAGMMAGANMSGDLKDPSTSIPKGTILAIITTSCKIFCAS